MTTAEWIVGTATAVALALGGWAMNTTASNETRISVNEERTSNLKEQLNKIDSAVNDLDRKLDRILERIPPRTRSADVAPPDVPPPARRRTETP